MTGITDRGGMTTTASARLGARRDRYAIAGRPTTAYAGSQGQWSDRAACRYHDPDLFFPLSAVGAGLAQTRQAKRVCATCPVVAECLDWAIAHGIRFGVWGGLSEDEREAAARGRHGTASTAGRPVSVLTAKGTRRAATRRDALRSPTK